MKQFSVVALCVSTLLAAACSGGSATPPPVSQPPATVDAAPPPVTTQPPAGSGNETPPPSSGTPDAAVVVSPPTTEPTDTSDGAAPPPSSDGGAVVVGPGDNASAPKGPFSCTLVLGISATGDWFKNGFENIVDNGRWELISVHNAFVNNWADPNDPLWKNKPSSACAMNPDNPDRVLLEALYLHWMDATVEQWTDVMEKAVTTLKARFSNLRNVEFSTFIRSPTDVPCPGNMPMKSFIRPEQDMAGQMVAAKHPDLVTVAPIVRVDSCDDYDKNPPHFTNKGNATKMGMKMGAVYKDRQ